MGLLIDFVWLIQVGTAQITDPNWLTDWPLKLVTDYGLAYAFLVAGTFFYYKFSQMIFGPGKEGRGAGEKLAPVVLFAILVWDVVRYPIQPDNLGDLEILYTVDIYIILYVIACLIPLIRGSRRLLARLNNSDEFYSPVRYILFTCFLLLLTMVMYVLETVYGVFTNSQGVANFFSFAAAAIVPVAIICAYRGFFRKKVGV